jgi:predicted nucleotidyltransferase
MQEKTEKLVREFVERMQDSLGEDLLAVLLYGSAASGDVQPEFSDVNLLAVLRVVGVAELRRTAATIEWWQGRKQSMPLLLSLEEARNAADAFPIEFLDITHNHRLLHGSDPFAGVAVNPQHHRRQVEHELRSLQMSLRSRYLTLLNSDDEIMDMLARSLSGFATLTRHALLLHGVEVGTRKRDILEAATRRLGMNPLPFETLLAVRERTQQLVGEAVDSLFSAYLEQISRVTADVDQLGRIKQQNRVEQ